MRSDINKIAFSTVGQGGTIADVEADGLFQIAFVADVSAVAGAPTSFRVVAVPLAADGTTVLGSATEHLRKTNDATATGKFILGKRDTAIAEPAIENVYRKIRLIADFTGGTAPTITGTLHIFSKRF